MDDEVSNYQGAGASDIFGAIPYQSVNRRAERSLSVFDIPHKSNSAVSYQVPFGRNKLWANWNISGLFMRSSGYPASAIAGNNGWFTSTGGGSALDGFTLRPDRVLRVPVINPELARISIYRAVPQSSGVRHPGDADRPGIGQRPAHSSRRAQPGPHLARRFGL